MAVLRNAAAERQSADGPSVPLELASLEGALSLVEHVPPSQAPRLLSQLATAQATLLARMLSRAEFAPAQANDDRRLNADEPAALLKVHRKWLYRRAERLPSREGSVARSSCSPRPGSEVDGERRAQESMAGGTPATRRGFGAVYLPTYKDKRTGELRQSSVCWIQYSVHGQRRIENSHSRNGLTHSSC
jgi:hypothetical protein